MKLSKTSTLTLALALILSPFFALNAFTQLNTESFTGYYYDNIDFTNLKLTRTDPKIDFKWGNGSPDPSIAPDSFSVRWEGDFTFGQEEYMFEVIIGGADAVRLYIDNELVLDKWFINWGGADGIVYRNMTAGSHRIKMEYYDWTGEARAELSWLKIKTVTLPFAKGEHPRILITSADIPALAAKVDEPTDPLYTRYIAMKQEVDQTITNNTVLTYANPTMAFVYLIEDYLHPTANNSVYVNAVKQGLENGNVNATMYSSESWALVYDWIYTGLSPQDRITLGNKLMASDMFQSDPNTLGLDEWHGMMSNQPSAKWTYAYIAIWNETDLNGNVDNLLAQTKLNQIRQFLTTKKIPFTNMVGGSINPDGTRYDITGTSLFALELYAWDKATGEDLWITSRYLRDNIITRLFAWRQYANSWVLFGHPPGGSPGLDFSNYGPFNAILSKKDTTGIAQYITNDVFKIPIKYPWGSLKPAWEYYKWIIFYDPAKPATNYNTLPLAHYAQGYNADGTAPIDGLDAGWGFFRSGWTKDDTLIAFTSGDVFTGKQPESVNAFSIYRGGDLAVFNSQDQSSVGESPTISSNYGKRSVAVNSITVSDPNVAMDEGQELFPGDSSYKWTNLSTHYKGAPADRGDITKFETKNSYDYTVGDGSKAYHPDRLTNFQRALAFLDKKYLVVFDRVTATQPNFVKRWYLHTIREPQIPGTPLADTSTVDGATTWSQADFNNQYMDSDLAGAPGSGRLFVKSLLPQGATLRKRGGEGFFFWRNDRSWNPGPGSMADRTDTFFEGRKGWRLEQDISGQNDDIFLNVLFPTDATVTTMAETVRIHNSDGNIATANMVGAHIQDPDKHYIALFSSDPKGVEVSSVTYTANYDSSTNGQHFLFDIAQGAYDVYKNGTKIHTGLIPSEKGVLTFESFGGSTFVITQTGTTLIGDITSDSQVNIQDIQACINHILGAQDWGAKADVNGDGPVNILDVQRLVNIVLGG